MSDSSPLPPVRLTSEPELARDALAAPLLLQAVRLARWAGSEEAGGTEGAGEAGEPAASPESAGPGAPADTGGGLPAELLPAAAETLGLAGETAESEVRAAWRVATGAGLVRTAGAADADTDADADELRLITSGAPGDVLRVWLRALETVLADASLPDLGDLLRAVDENGAVDFSAIDWDPRAEAEFLEGILGNLYLMTAKDGGLEGDAGPVPLPALAASMILPSGTREPTDAVLEQVSRAMMRLDRQFRMLAAVGLVEYRPVDETVMATADGEDGADGADGANGSDGSDEPAVTSPVEEADVVRYGMVRLTPLGLYGLRVRLRDAGFAVPLVGDLAGKGADVLLDGISGYAPAAAHAETEQWLARREPLDAARELLAAARGGDAGAPLRRLRCQQALSLVGAPAEPALREVLDDPELGGLARVWLSEGGAADVPPPSRDMVFWLTVDTVAAQLAAEGNSEELRALVQGLAAQHSEFFDTAWRVGHPATAEVLDAMGRLHPDRAVAKQARRAAFKARSQQGS